MESIFQKIQRNNKQGLRELFYKKVSFVYYNVLNRVQNKNAEVVRLLTKQIFAETYKTIQTNKTFDYREDGIDHLLMERVDYYCGIYSKLLKSYYHPFEDDNIEQPKSIGSTLEKPVDSFAKPEIGSVFNLSEEQQTILENKPRMPLVFGKKKRKFSWSVAFLIPLIILLLWIITGILVEMKWIPDLDLGYLWFNKTFFSLF